MAIVVRYQGKDVAVDGVPDGYRVKWWNEKRGFGFLSADDRSDLFIHAPTLQAVGRLKQVASDNRF